MLELVLEYALFFAKTLTIVLSIGALILLVAMVARREDTAGTLKVEKLNDRFEGYAHVLRSHAMSKKAFKADEKARRKARKKADKASDRLQTESVRRRVYVLDFKGDIRASGSAGLREEVTAVLSLAADDDEVLVRLENSGGIVHDHGLAASQLARLRARGVPLTIAVDKVAASGGYMMACVASRIIAAPFAVLGSIGVVAQLPNFNRLLRENGVDFELFTAGQFKRTVTMFGENTDEGRQKFSQEIQETHELFKAFVAEHRPRLDLEKVATGEHWYGRQALELKLCDEIKTSDDWLFEQAKLADVFHVTYKAPEPLGRRILHGFEGSLSRVLDTLLQRSFDSRFDS